MGSSSSATNCACGNPAALLCGECSRGVCRLCVRTSESGVAVCLACRSAAIERAEERAAGRKSGRFAASSARLRAAVTGSARLPRTTRVRKHLILLPFVVVSLLALMAAVAVPLLAEARGA
ncbi:MAG: hypothetical protein ACAI25_01710, partial [Planctomycetota bacterium]